MQSESQPTAGGQEKLRGGKDLIVLIAEVQKRLKTQSNHVCYAKVRVIVGEIQNPNLIHGPKY